MESNHDYQFGDSSLIALIKRSIKTSHEPLAFGYTVLIGTILMPNPAANITAFAA